MMFYKTAEIDVGNDLVRHGTALRVPNGSWRLSYKSNIDKERHQVSLEFNSLGQITRIEPRQYIGEISGSM